MSTGTKNYFSKKTLEPDLGGLDLSQLSLDRATATLVEPWTAGAPMPPLSGPSAWAWPPWRRWSRAWMQWRWSRARTCGCVGVEPGRGGGGVEPGHAAAVESSPDGRQRWSQDRTWRQWCRAQTCNSGGVEPGRAAAAESSPDVATVATSCRRWGVDVARRPVPQSSSTMIPPSTHLAFTPVFTTAGDTKEQRERSRYVESNEKERWCEGIELDIER
jgi:hypothetical protein